jgi:sec-independent protein translocase protein TatB
VLDFNLGFAEVVTLVVLGIVIFGPDKLPEFARKAGRVVRYVRGIANNARAQIQSEIPELAEVDLTELNPKALAGSLLAPLEEVKQEVVPLAKDVSGSLGPVPSVAVDAPAAAAKTRDPEWVADEPASADLQSGLLESAAEGEKTVPFDPEAT